MDKIEYPKWLYFYGKDPILVDEAAHALYPGWSEAPIQSLPGQAVGADASEPADTSMPRRRGRPPVHREG